MNEGQLFEQPRGTDDEERRKAIEAATRERKDRRMRAAAEALKDLYEPGGELTEWTCLDSEDFLDDTAPS